MRNAVYDLDYGTLETLRMQLNKLRSCKGAKECTIRYKYEGKYVFIFNFKKKSNNGLII